MKKIVIAFLFISIVMTSLSIARKVFFAYQANENVKSVAVIGTFNNWSPTVGKMKRAFGTVWTTQIEIPDGVYFYDFLVDGKIVADSHNPKRKPNGKGGFYSVLIVGTFTPPKGVAGDGIIHKSYVTFDEHSRIYVNPASTNTIYFAIDTLKDDVQFVSFETGDKLYPMKRVNLNQYSDRYKMVFHSSKKKFSYRFVIEDGNTKFYMGRDGIATPSRFFTFDFSSPTVSILSAPSWADGAVVYEIFPDRFFNGDTSNDPAYTMKWGGTPTYDNFFGGDLQGIMDKVNYLEDLGIGVLYTTPIFKSPSNHKYNTCDYMKVDRHFGTVETFEKLIKALHSKDMKWVVDGVFNHTGTSFFAFQDLLKNQKKSKYVDWYFVKRFPIRIEPGDYATFQNYPSLPKLNTTDPDVQKYLKKVVDYWTSKGVDGWRIDSANTISNSFLTKLYKWIHEVKPSSLDVAEIWTNVSNWFNEGAFNSTMNYLFKDAAYSYLVYGAGAQAFLDDTDSYLNSYPPQLWNALWNLIDSHDTPRALTALDGNVEKMKALVGLQMTFVGAPMIYYGDEIGMTGGRDPLNRRCMIWNEHKWNSDLHDWYKLLVKIRNETPAIKLGSYVPLFAKGQVFGFKRSYEKQSVYVFINGGKSVRSVQTRLVGNFLNLVNDSIWSSKSEPIVLELQPYEVLILKEVEK